MSPGADVRLPVAGPWGLPRCSSSCRSPRHPEAVLPLPLLTVPVPSQDSPPFLPPSSRMRWASPTWKRTARRRRGVRPSPGPPSTPPRPCGRLARHLETWGGGERASEQVFRCVGGFPIRPSCRFCSGAQSPVGRVASRGRVSSSWGGAAVDQAASVWEGRQSSSWHPCGFSRRVVPGRRRAPCGQPQAQPGRHARRVRLVCRHHRVHVNGSRLVTWAFVEQTTKHLP